MSVVKIEKMEDGYVAVSDGTRMFAYGDSPEEAIDKLSRMFDLLCQFRKERSQYQNPKDRSIVQD